LRAGGNGTQQLDRATQRLCAWCAHYMSSLAYDASTR
jgi:hypothetical protein